MGVACNDDPYQIYTNKMSDTVIDFAEESTELETGASYNEQNRSEFAHCLIPECYNNIELNIT